MQTITPDLQTALAQPGLIPKSRVLMHLSNNRAFDATVTAPVETNKDRIIDGQSSTALQFAYTDISKTDNFERVWPTDADDYDFLPWAGNSSSATIEVTYPQTVQINQITVASPNQNYISNMTVRFGSGGYTTVFSGAVSESRVTYWLQSDDGSSWSTTPNYSFITSADSIKIDINAMSNGGDAMILEFDCGIDVDASDDTISWDVQKERDLSAQSLSPIGLSAANTASFVLDNSDNKYNTENESSPYHKMITPNTKIELWIAFRKADLTYEYLRQGIFFIDTISLSGDTTALTVQARDGSKYLQDNECPALLYENVLVHEIIKDVVMRAGIEDYDIDTSIFQLPDMTDGEIADLDDIATIVCVPKKLTIWSEEGQTFWAFLQEIALADMGVFYFDEDGKFHFKVKESLTDKTREDWQTVTTLGEDTLLSAGYSVDLVTNSFKLEYQIPKKSKKRVGLWEADNPSLLRATTLDGSITADDTTIPANTTIDSDTNGIQDWPRQGYFKIGNEVIKYSDRGLHEFKKCTRGELNTTPASHSGSTTMFEVRKYEIEYSVTPAADFSYLLTNETYVEILSMVFTPHDAEIWVVNQNAGYTILEGSYVAKAVEGFPEAFLVIGRAIETGETKTLEQQDNFSIRKYGKREYSLNLKWVQSPDQAQQILDYLVTLYSTPTYFLDVEMIARPELQLGDVVDLDWTRLGLLGMSFHVVSMKIGMAGGGAVTQTLRLRSQWPDTTTLAPQFFSATFLGSSEAGIMPPLAPFTASVLPNDKHASVDVMLKKLISGVEVSHRLDAYIYAHKLEVSIDSLLRKSGYTKSSSVDVYVYSSLLRTLYSGVDVLLPNKAHRFSRIDILLRKPKTVTTSMSSHLKGSKRQTSSVSALLGHTQLTYLDAYLAIKQRASFVDALLGS